MIAFLAYALLAIITAGCSFVTRALWRRCHDISIPFGLGIIYVWTFLGAWFFIGDAALGFQGYRIGFSYYYLMEKMFPFRLDPDYLRALAGYGLFMAGLFAALGSLVPRERGSVVQRVAMSREALIATGLLAMIVSIWAVWSVILQAIDQKTSVYMLLNGYGGWRKSLHAFANEAAGMVLLLGYAVRNVRDRPGGPFIEEGKFLPGWSYVAAIVLLCIWLSAVGDRHSLLMAFLLSTVMMFAVNGRMAWRPVVILGVICGVALVAGGELRTTSWGGARTTTTVGSPEVPFHEPSIAHVPRKRTTLAQGIGAMVFSNELFAAHFSYYGALTRDVPVSPGISLRYLTRSFAPADARPPTAYDHYASFARLVPGQGYTIHHATAWYINGSWFGVLVGGALLGALWALLVRFARSRARWAWPRLLPWAFVAFLPALVRNGPEGFKSLLIEGLLLPVVVVLPAIWLASVMTRGAKAIDMQTDG